MEKLQTMSNALYIFFILGALAIFGLAVPGPLRDHFNNNGNNIDISLSEEKETIRLVTYFPTAKTRAVHEYIRNQFGIHDLPDLAHVEIYEYRTPDSMTFYLRTRHGFLEIAMDRLRNTQAAYERVKSASKGLEGILITKP